MSHYSTCHPSSLLCPPPSRSPIFFPFACFFTSCRCICHTPFFHLSSFFLSFSVLTICLKPAHLPQCLHPQNSTPLSLLVFFDVLSLHPSIHHSPLSLTLSPPLISLSMLWFVSHVSVRTVITAVSSLGENKVVLCSRHHKRHKRNKRKEPQPKKRKRWKGEKLKRRGVN